MTTTIAADQGRATQSTVVRAGRWCLVAGLVGVAQGLALAAWPHQVPDTRFSFPLTATGHVVAQATFALQHLPLVVAVAVLAGVPAVRRVVAARRWLLVATAGLALLTVTEVVAMVAADAEADSTLASTISAVYGLPTIMTGVGMLVAGVLLVRRRVVAAPLGWTVLALGGWVLVGLIPLLAAAQFTLARFGIVVWMLLFAVLGLVLQRDPVDEKR